MEYKNNRTANRRRYKSRYHSPHNYKTQRSKSENRAAILIAIATFLVIASLVLVFTFGDNIYAFFDRLFHPSVQASQQATEPIDPSAPTVDPSAAAAAATTPSAAPTQAATEPPTDAPTEIPQDPVFVRLMTAAGLDPENLYGTQLIFVESSGTSATVHTYEKDDAGVWRQKFSPVSGYVGAGGVASSVGPEDNTTPIGTFNIEYAMGVNSDPGTMLKYYTIRDGMKWITDPASANYNRLINVDDITVDYSKFQNLSEYTISYPYAVVFDYNRNPVDSSMGCAKFLHVSKAPTKAGGIGIPEAELKNILLWLDPGASPMITIF